MRKLRIARFLAGASCMAVALAAGFVLAPVVNAQPVGGNVQPQPVMPRAMGPNVVVILLDDVGFPGGGAFGGALRPG